MKIVDTSSNRCVQSPILLKDKCSPHLAYILYDFFSFYHQEITLWRKGEKARKIGAGMAQSPIMNAPTHLVSGDHSRREINVESDDAAHAPGVESMKREVDSPTGANNSDGVDTSPAIQSPLEANPPPLSD